MDQNKVAQVLADSASTLVKVAHERDVYQAAYTKVAQQNEQLLKRMDAEKVAMDMRERGINEEVPLGDLVDSLYKQAQEDPNRFEVIKEAVGLTGPDMFKTASIGGKQEAREENDFERFILGAVS